MTWSKVKLCVITKVIFLIAVILGTIMFAAMPQVVPSEEPIREAAGWLCKAGGAGLALTMGTELFTGNKISFKEVMFVFWGLVYLAAGALIVGLALPELDPSGGALYTHGVCSHMTAMIVCSGLGMGLVITGICLQANREDSTKQANTDAGVYDTVKSHEYYRRSSTASDVYADSRHNVMRSATRRDPTRRSRSKTSHCRSDGAITLVDPVEKRDVASKNVTKSSNERPRPELEAHIRALEAQKLKDRLERLKPSKCAPAAPSSPEPLEQTELKHSWSEDSVEVEGLVLDAEGYIREVEALEPAQRQNDARRLLSNFKESASRGSKNPFQGLWNTIKQQSY